MRSPNNGTSLAGQSPGPNLSPDGSARVSLAFLAVIALGVLVAAYPLVSLVVLTGVVALAALSRSLASHVGPDGVGRITFPRLGTVEYRFTRS